jgi:hypothetical protein
VHALAALRQFCQNAFAAMGLTSASMTGRPCAAWSEMRGRVMMTVRVSARQAAAPGWAAVVHDE